MNNLKEKKKKKSGFLFYNFQYNLYQNFLLVPKLDVNFDFNYFNQ